MRELRVFLTLAEELRFARAAERLQINRSRVSQIINGLEAKVGSRLLARTSRRVLIVARDHPLARRDSVSIEDLARYLASDVPALNREMMDPVIPPVTRSGQRLRRLARAFPEETIMRLARGDRVQPPARRWFDYFKDAHDPIRAAT